jgi:hypothetical protein
MVTLPRSPARAHRATRPLTSGLLILEWAGASAEGGSRTPRASIDPRPPNQLFEAQVIDHNRGRLGRVLSLDQLGAVTDVE